MTKNNEVLVICGSLRRQSHNKMICNTLPELSPTGMTFKVAPDFSDVPIYSLDVHADIGFPEKIEEFATAIRAASGVIIVSPEYNYSIPGALKNTIDWISRVPDQPFAGKPIALQSAAAGMLGGARAQYHLRQVMVFLEAVVLTKPEVFVSFAESKVDKEKGVVIDEATRNAISAQLIEFSKFIDRLGPYNS